MHSAPCFSSLLVAVLLRAMADAKQLFFGEIENRPPVFLTLDESERAYRAFPADELASLLPTSAGAPGATSDFWDDSLQASTAAAAPDKLSFQAKELIGDHREAAMVATSEVPPEPEYYEPWSSFPTNDRSILLRANNALARSGGGGATVLKFDVGKFKIKGTFPSRDGTTGKFTIFLYKRASGADDAYLFEVVRRSGDIILFNDLFQHLKAQLGADANGGVVADLPDTASLAAVLSV
jgi:hypothetical protein